VQFSYVTYCRVFHGQEQLSSWAPGGVLKESAVLNDEKPAIKMGSNDPENIII